jgi:hypothetical protein
MKEAITNANNGRTNNIYQFKAGEKKDKLRFIPEKLQPITDRFKQPDGTVIEKSRYQFTFVDLESINPKEEKIWKAPLTAAKDVIKWLDRKKTVLSVEREGSGLKDTRYYIAPAETS